MEKVLNRFSMENCKSVSSPLAAHFRLPENDSPKSEDEIEYMANIPYSNTIGSLMYAMIYTRPDLAYSVSVVSRYMHNPGKAHWNSVKWILRYLKGTSDLGLLFDSAKSDDIGVVSFVDSDYGGDVDKRRSFSRYLFTLCGSAISWKSSLQSVIALSTTEAEYIASTEGVKEAIWIRGLVSELGVGQEVLTVFCDSQSAIHLTKNNHYHEKTKHIAICHHFIRDIVTQGEIEVCKVHILENPADMLTKTLCATKFEYCLDLVNLSSV